MKTKGLSKDEKIAVLKKIMAGEMTIKKGVFIPQTAMVVISHDGHFYTDNSMETELPVELLEDYTGNMVVLPANNR